MLQYDEKIDVLRKFPKIELSYEKTIHKKVHSSNLYITIPKGPKYFAWFQYFKNCQVCFFLKLYKRKKIEDIIIRTCCFHPSLCFGTGTILYGTMFMENCFFNVEDIFFFKNRDVSHQNQYEKFNILEDLFSSYIKQYAFHSSNIVFGLPMMHTNYNKLRTMIHTAPYKLYCIQHRLLYKKSIFLNERIVSDKQFALFFVKSDVVTDIYWLYCKKNGFVEKYSIANIPNFKTSVLMNSLFRNIKENRNLDALEESDDEEEFENIRDDKYVYLDKIICMKCVYCSRYNRWTPLEMVDSKIVTGKSEILLMEKK